MCHNLIIQKIEKWSNIGTKFHFTNSKTRIMCHYLTTCSNTDSNIHTIFCNITSARTFLVVYFEFSRPLSFGYLAQNAKRYCAIKDDLTRLLWLFNTYNTCIIYVHFYLPSRQERIFLMGFFWHIFYLVQVECE